MWTVANGAAAWASISNPVVCESGVLIVPPSGCELTSFWLNSRPSQRALVAHEALAMPIERARSLLVLGGIRRRLRKRRAAKAALDEALAIFESAGAPLWAARAEAEIDCVGLRPRAAHQLTPSEQRVATLVASGLKNREVAAALVVSQKTVEAHLARAFRKLGVRSRTQLAARMTQLQAAELPTAVPARTATAT